MGEALGDIVESSTKVNTLLTEIASASQEQADGIEQVNKGVAELDKVTQQNAGNSEELAAGAQETASQVGTLTETVGAFKTRGEADAKKTTNIDFAKQNAAPKKPAANRAPPPPRARRMTTPSR